MILQTSLTPPVSSSLAGYAGESVRRGSTGGLYQMDLWERSSQPGGGRELAMKMGETFHLSAAFGGTSPQGEALGEGSP